MLGDIKPNKPVSNTAVAPVAPAGPPRITTGYGSSSFGPSSSQPVSAPVQAQNHFVPAPNATTAPVAAPHAPVMPAATPSPVSLADTVTPAPAPKSSKAPLFITLTGALIFVGGVAGLFIYALSA